MTTPVLILIIAVSMLVPAGAAGRPDAQIPAGEPSAAVFQIAVVERRPGPDGIMHEQEYGTGFFISSDGTALTASHVVYRAVYHPEAYRLVADVGKEFYDAEVVCASRLPYDPLAPDSDEAGVPATRDVARIKLAPSTAPEGHRRRFSTTKSGERTTIATAHTGALPLFPFLTIGDHPGSRVRVLGLDETSPLPRKRTAHGKVVQIYSSERDGTPLFDILSPSPPVPGDSGAPVIDDQNRVVGLWAWLYDDKPGTGTAEGSSVLKRPCG